MRTLHLLTTLMGIFYPFLLFSQFQGWGLYDSTNSALPSSMVTSVDVAANNKVWIATNAGLVSFQDLIDWNVYTTSNSNLASNWISKVKVDADDKLWYATQSGFLGYLNNTTFVNFTASNSPLGAFPVTDFDFLGNEVWVTTNGGGVFKYDGSNWQNYNALNLGLPIDAAQSITVNEAAGEVCIGTFNDGLFIYQGVFWSRLYSLNSNIPNDNIAAAYREADTVLWLGIGTQLADSCLLRVNNTQVQIVDSAYTNGVFTRNIRDVYVDPNGVKWFASNNDQDGGLIRFNDTTFTRYHMFNSGLPTNKVYQSAMDDSSNLWIATFLGLAAFNEKNFYLAQSESQYPVLYGWPNPVNTVMHFSLPQMGKGFLQISNAQGVMVYEKDADFAQTNTLDLHALKPGFYFMQLSQGNSAYLLRFVKL